MRSCTSACVMAMPGAQEDQRSEMPDDWPTRQADAVLAKYKEDLQVPYCCSEPSFALCSAVLLWDIPTARHFLSLTLQHVATCCSGQNAVAQHVRFTRSYPAPQIQEWSAAERDMLPSIRKRLVIHFTRYREILQRKRPNKPLTDAEVGLYHAVHGDSLPSHLAGSVWRECRRLTSKAAPVCACRCRRCRCPASLSTEICGCRRSPTRRAPPAPLHTCAALLRATGEAFSSIRNVLCCERRDELERPARTRS